MQISEGFEMAAFILKVIIYGFYFIYFFLSTNGDVTAKWFTPRHPFNSGIGNLELQNFLKIPIEIGDFFFYTEKHKFVENFLWIINKFLP